MSTMRQQMIRIIDDYLAENDIDTINPEEVGRWAIRNRRWRPQPREEIRLFAKAFSDAMRNEFIVDDQGRKVRSKHVARTASGGRQLSLWKDIRKADRTHMAKSVQQRRNQIVGDCTQLRTDVDSYNDNYNKEEPLQIVLDFTRDVEERVGPKLRNARLGSKPRNIRPRLHKTPSRILNENRVSSH